MRRAWTAVFLVAGCGSSDGAGDDFPIQPGGGAGGGGAIRDAAIDAPIDGALPIAGRVCLTRDLRALDACATTGADGLTVRLGAATATTVADGTFTIARPASADLWRVSGGAIVPSVMPPAVGDPHRIPAITVADHAALISANLVTLQPGQGSVVARVVRGTAPEPGAVAFAEPLAANPTFYDGASAATWEVDATGPAGIAWLPGIPVGAATIAVIAADRAAASSAAPVEDGAITYLTVELP